MKLTKEEQYKILVEEFNKRHDKTLDVYDESLRDRLGGKSPRTIQRLIGEFQAKYNSVIEVAGRRRKTYKLATPMDLITESFDHFEDLAWFFQMAHDADPEVFKALEEHTRHDKHIYKFKNTPFEDISSIESKQSFQRLKRIIEAREYAKITFLNDEDAHDNLKCLKLVFMDSNWYVAFVDTEEKLRFGRINFIEKVDYGSKTGHFQPSLVAKQMQFLENVQNSMTLYGEEKKVATIKATPKIARYFDKGMKIFLSSQKFKEKLDDGSVIFTLEYTQELEILPFIQKWLPDLIILEPQELKVAYVKKLEKTILNNK